MVQHVSPEAAYFSRRHRCTPEAKQAEKLVEEEEVSSAIEATGVSVTDEELLCRVGLGSKDALTALFRKHRRAVLNVAGRILRDVSEAEDLCQDVFLLLFEKAKLFDASKGTASSWIIQIAYHRTMNRRRQYWHTGSTTMRRNLMKNRPVSGASPCSSMN